ncbi:hypothetical protein ACLBXM_09985 [Xanthobacteraceae bacterium A53D]
MSERFDADMIDYAEVLRRLGDEALTDQDFDMFKCPGCRSLYLTDYEHGTVFTDGRDLRKHAPDHLFRCTLCGWQPQDNEPIIGPKAAARFHPTIEDVRKSPWGWVLRTP